MKSLWQGLVCAGLLSVGLHAAERPLTVDLTLSHVDVQVKATVDSFVGKLASYDAQLKFDDAAGHVTAAVFRFNFGDLKTGKADRDAQMNEWQQTAKFPEVVFTMTSLASGADGRLLATGQLKLHGVERTLTFPIAVTADKSVFAIDGEAKIDTREFGLPVIRKFAVLKVDPNLVVRFHLQGSIPVK